MINFNKKDAVADAVAKILQQEEIDVNDRTEDMIGGRVKTKRKDDVGPGTDGKSTKVRFHAGPKNEEVEQIDELSKDTLKSYVKKSSGSLAVNSARMGGTDRQHHKKDYFRNVSKRMGGIAQAADRLAKEEVEQIDELSKKTLGSYAKKAFNSYSNTLGNMGDEGSDMSKKDYKKATKTLTSRDIGLKKAVDRLAKEETERVLASTKPTAIQKTRKPEPEKMEDKEAKRERKMQGMRESISLKMFKEKFEESSIYDDLINEVLSKDASAGEWIHDFVHSDNPKFAGKSKEERKKQALAAYYAKQKKEEVELEEGLGDKLKVVGKKALEKLGHGSDEDMKKDLQKKMGIPQTGKMGMAKKNEEVEQVEEGIASGVGKIVKKIAPKWVAKQQDKAKQTHDKAKSDAVNKYLSHTQKEETEQVEEGWDDMVKAAQDKVKSGPKPSGGSGMKKGTRYGGGKQTDKPEHDEKPVKEATDTVEKDPKTGKVKSWKHEGDWKKSTDKEGRGKVTHASDVARRKTEKMSEAKDPGMDAGCGSQPNFATNDSKPLKVAKTLAKKSMARMKNEMLGKAPGNN